MRADPHPRCYECALRNRAGADACARCGAALLAMCSCGAQHSVFESACPRCGAAALPARYPTLKLQRVRLLIAAPFLMAAIGAAVVLSRAEVREPWRVKAEAAQHFDAEEFDRALKLYAEASALDPRDAVPHYMMAVCYARLGFEPEQYLEQAEIALRLSPDFAPALLLLAQAADNDHRLAQAIDYASQATRSPGAPARAHRMRADLELKRPLPDLALALEQFQLARQKQDDTPGLDLRIAQTQLSLYGSTQPGHYPPQLTAALAETARTLDGLNEEGVDPVERAIARARIEIALEHADRAYTFVDTALLSLPKNADPDVRARLLITRGSALLQRDAADAAMNDFSQALSIRPVAQNAAEIALSLSGAGQFEALENLLVHVAQTNDPEGDVRAVLAAHLLRTGDTERALEAIQAARARSPRNAIFAELEGDVRTASNDLAGAADSYDAALREAPGLTSAKVRRAVLPLRRVDDDADREPALRAAAARLREIYDADPGEPSAGRALAEVLLALADSAGARTVLEKAVRRAPGDAQAWALLGRAQRGEQAADALVRAAESFQRAWQLRPEDPALGEQEAQAWLEAGYAARAVVACNSILRYHKELPSSLRLRAAANRQLNQYAQAAADLRTLRAGGDASPGTLLDLADALFRSGRMAEAKQLIRDTRDAQSADLRESLDLLAVLHEMGEREAVARLTARGPSMGLARLHLAAGRVEDAVSVLRTLRTARPADGTTAVLLVIALLDRDDPSAAALDEAAAIGAALGPDAPIGVREFIEGRVALARGDIERARDALRVAATHQPTSSFVLLFYGEAILRSGNRVEGLATLRRAVQLPGAPLEVSRFVARRVLQESYSAKTPFDAEARAREALRLDATSLAAARRLTDLLVARGAYVEAAQLAEALLADPGITPETKRALLIQAIVARISAGETARALVHLDSLDAAPADRNLAGVLRGLALVQSGRWSEGAALLRPLVNDPQVGGLASMGYSSSLVRSAAFDEAARFASERRSTQPGAPDIGLHLAREFRAVHEYERALEQVRAYGERNPEDPITVIETLRLEARLARPEQGVQAARTFAANASAARAPSAKLLLARALLAYGDAPDEALALCRTLEDPASPVVRVLARALEAEANMVAGDTARARSIVDELTASWQQDTPVSDEDRAAESEVRFVRGVLAMLRQYWAAAVTDLSRCRELDPSNETVRNNLAFALAHTSDGALRGHEIAVALTEEAQRNPDYWDTRGVAAERAGRVDDAETSFRAALELFKARGPKALAARAETHLRLVRLLRRVKRYDESADEARKLISEAPDTPSAAEAERFLRSGDDSGR